MVNLWPTCCLPTSMDRSRSLRSSWKVKCFHNFAADLLIGTPAHWSDLIKYRLLYIIWSACQFSGTVRLELHLVFRIDVAVSGLNHLILISIICKKIDLDLYNFLLQPQAPFYWLLLPFSSPIACARLSVSADNFSLVLSVFHRQLRPWRASSFSPLGMKVNSGGCLVDTCLTRNPATVTESTPGFTALFPIVAASTSVVPPLWDKGEGMRCQGLALHIV